MAYSYRRYQKKGHQGRRTWTPLTAAQWALVCDYFEYAQRLTRKHTNDRDLAHDLAMDALVRAAPHHRGGKFAALVQWSVRCRLYDYRQATHRQVPTVSRDAFDSIYDFNPSLKHIDSVVDCDVFAPREHEPFSEVDAADLGSFLTTGCDPRFRAIVADVVAGEAWFTAARRRGIRGGFATLLRDRGRDHATARRARI